MEVPLVLQMMPRGEQCPHCGSGRWYLQDGLGYCSRGHQIQGFVEFGAEEEEKEDEEVGTWASENPQGPQLSSGPDEKLVFLYVLQTLLQKQVRWLVSNKGYGRQLETVVRDLWDVRTRECSFLLSAEGHGEMETCPPSPDAKEMNASRAEEETNSCAEDIKRSAGWQKPRVSETIALCFLGAQLLRLPIRQADLLKWANDGEMPYKTVFLDLPLKTRERIPISYFHELRLPLHKRLAGEELSRTVVDLAHLFHSNYNMFFPDLNHVSLLVQYAKSLALPVEPVIVAKKLAAMLGSRFSYPVKANRILPLDHPEIHVVALLVVATKLCLPFSGSQHSHPICEMPFEPRFDWDAWKRVMKARTNYERHSMPSALEHQDAHLEASRSSSQAAEMPPNREDLEIKNCQPMIQTLEPPLEPGQNNSTNAATLTAFCKVEDLSETAATFYKAAADSAGIALDFLVRAVYDQEQPLLSRQSRRTE